MVRRLQNYHQHKDGIVKGEMPGRALKMILEWQENHKEEQNEADFAPEYLYEIGTTA